jgi:hypothetical protein
MSELATFNAEEAVRPPCRATTDAYAEVDVKEKECSTDAIATARVTIAEENFMIKKLCSSCKMIARNSWVLESVW